MGFIQLKLPKRIKRRLANTERLRKVREQHEAWKKKHGLDNIKTPKDRGEYVSDWKPDPNYPKTSDKIPVYEPGSGSKKEEMVYSGERRLVGIATMHKSNQVPVFADDDDVSGRKKATEITLMKGNK